MRRIEGEGPNPSGLCICGCGRKTPLAQVSRRRNGDVAGTPIRYCLGHGYRKTARYIVDPATGCWEWQLYRDEQGYGKAFDSGRTRLAHQVAYEEAFGPIPEGMCVCHTCDNPPCVNPAHLFLGTQADNSHDRDRKGRGVMPRRPK